MQKKKDSGWRALGVVLGVLLVAGVALCAVFHLERKLVQVYRRTGERLRVRPSRFETDF